MYKLARICLQNWYLVQARDIDIRDATAFIGPTGAGKSSIQDAIQTVICGGSHRRIHLNASASGHSSRKVIDYCLGYLVPKADGGEPMRDSCETILVLNFEEENPAGPNRMLAVGVVMTARREDSREQIISRFLAPGCTYSVDDWKAEDEHGAYMLGWDDIARGLKARCPDFREYRTNSEKFVNDMLAEMRRHGKQPDVKHFLHAFTNAVAFKPIFDPTPFVRSYILEPDPLEIERVRASIAHWRDISTTARMVEEKLARLKAIRRQYENWGRAVVDRAAAHWGLANAGTERARVDYGRMAKALGDAEQRLSHHEAVEAQQKIMLEQARAELEQKRSTLGQSGADAKLQLIKAEQAVVLRDIKDVEAGAAVVRDAFRMAANLAEARAFMPNSFVPMVAAAGAALSIIDGKPGLDWLAEHGPSIDEHLAKVRGLAALPERLRAPIEAAQDALAGLRKKRDAIEDNLGRMTSGAAPLSDHTLALQRLLAAEGIEAVPLCDVTEVTDEEWQFAVEALLGGNREALIVEPSAVRRANDILFRNRNRHGLHRCRLVKTTYTSQVDTRVARDSIASMIATGNSHAMAFILVNIGGFKMVDTEADLERATRAVMKNGKTTSGMAYSVQQDLSLILGRRARDLSGERLRSELDGIKAEIATQTRTLSLMTQAARVAEQLGMVNVDLSTLAFRFDETRRRLRELEGRKASVLSAADAELAAEIDSLKADIEERRAELEETAQTVKKAAAQHGECKGRFIAARNAFRDAVRLKRTALARFADEDLQAVLKLVPDEERGQFQGRANPYLAKRVDFAADPVRALTFFKERMDEHRESLKGMDDRIGRLGSAARSSLDKYLHDHAIERPMRDDAPFRVDYAWATWQTLRLEQNELRQYREKAAAAEREMIFTIKEDLLTKLNSKFQKLEIQLRTLNQQLKNHKFTGQIYKFGKKPDPAFDRIRRLAIEVGNNPDKAQSIVEGRIDDPVLQAALGELNQYLEANGGEGLEDYRNYYTFDLYMRPASADEDESLDIDEDEVRKRGLISLSARATVGSGGEGQAPFYVAIAASMALAYYPGGHPDGTPSGMGLVLFDEAFNKLDIPTTQALIRFFKDLGLQLIIAAPEDKRPTFTEVLDTLVSVNKDTVNQTVYLASEFPKEKLKMELAAINPDHTGVEGFRRQLAPDDYRDVAE